MKPEYSKEFWYWYDRCYLQDPNILKYKYDDEKMWEAWKASQKLRKINIMEDLCKNIYGWKSIARRKLKSVFSRKT